MKMKNAVRDNYVFLLLGLLVIIVAFFSVTKFDTLWNLGIWKSMAAQFPEFGVMTLGVMVCFISGNIDLSFVALGDLAAILACKLMQQVTGGNIPEGQTGIVIFGAVLIAFLVGGIGGLINGNLITRLGIPPILATLATQLVFKGISVGLTQGNAVSGIPDIYSEVGHTNVFGFLPFPLLVFLVIFILFAVLLRFTTYGEKLYLIGANPKASRFSAINTTKVVNTSFVINGVCAAIGGLLMVISMNSAKADYGSSYLMRCILILVLAGVLPDGGIGRIFNVLISIVIIQIIASCVNMFPELNSYYGNLIWGTLLIVILMATSTLLRERKLRIKLKYPPKDPPVGEKPSQT